MKDDPELEALEPTFEDTVRGREEAAFIKRMLNLSRLNDGPDGPEIREELERLEMHLAPFAPTLDDLDAYFEEKG